jgi:acyl-CoA thioester hydrolase
MNKLNIRVSYRDTDKMGVVYYANYFVFFEMGRTELMRQIGFTYDEMEKQGLYFPVVNAQCNYHAPAHYDDLITVETTISELKNVTVTFSYKIKCDDKVLVTGSTKHPLVNYAFKPTRIPQNLKDLLQGHVENNN